MVLGWGLLSQFSPFRYFPHFPLLSKQTLAVEYHVYIWQVSPQLSCGDTCQIWMWFKESNRYFCKIEIFVYGEISERSFSNPRPRSEWCICVKKFKNGTLNRHCFISCFVAEQTRTHYLSQYSLVKPRKLKCMPLQISYAKFTEN